MSTIRETHKDITLSGKQWRVKKFDPLSGSFVLLKVMSRLSSVVVGALSGAFPDTGMMVMAVAQQMGDIPSIELLEIQIKCLSVCYELVTTPDNKTGEVVVRTAQGSWGVDPPNGPEVLTILALTAHAVVFNMLPFLEGDELKQVAESFKSYSLPFAAPTSMSSPGDQ